MIEIEAALRLRMSARRLSWKTFPGRSDEQYFLPVRKLWPSPCRKNCSLFTLIQVLDTNNLLSKSLLNSVGWEYLGTEHSCDFCVYSGSVPTARASDGCSAPPVIFSAPSLAVEVRWDPLGSPRWLVAAEEAKTMQGRLSNYDCSCSTPP